MSRHKGPMQAVIKEAIDRDQKDPSSWAKISPDEASAIRESYRASEEEIERLRGILFKCGFGAQVLTTEPTNPPALSE